MLHFSRFYAGIILSVIFIVFPVICILQGLPGDISSDPEMVGFVPNLFYRPFVGGDEAWWDYTSSLLFSVNPFYINEEKMSVISFLLGYVDLGDVIGSSSFYVFYLYVLKTVFRHPYLVIAAKGLIDLVFILWIYKSSSYDFVRARGVESRIVSFVCIFVLLSPFFWWWAFSFQRDDILVVLATYLLFLFSKKTIGTLSGRRYCLVLLALCIIFLNIKMYSVVLPLTFLYFYLIGSRKIYLRSISKTTLLLVLTVFGFALLPIFVIYLKDYSGVVTLLFTTITSYFKPLPVNVLTIPMGEAAPLVVVYLFNWFVVFSFFLCTLLIFILKPAGLLRSLSLILPIVVADLLYRLILTRINGDVLGVRQCMTVLPLDLYIAFHFISRHFMPLIRSTPSKFIIRVSSPPL
jgi:hypothetical protein